MFSDLKDETRQEIWGVILIATTVLGYLALWTDTTGAFGLVVQRGLNILFGVAAPVVPAATGLVGLVLVFQRGRFVGGSRGVGWALLAAVALGCLHRLGTGIPDGYEFRNVTLGPGLGGGLIGAALTWSLREAFGPLGRDVVLASLGAVAVLLATDVSLIRLFRGSHRAVSVAGRKLGAGVGKLLGVFDERDRSPRTAPERGGSRRAGSAADGPRPRSNAPPLSADSPDNEADHADGGWETRDVPRPFTRGSGARGGTGAGGRRLSGAGPEAAGAGGWSGYQQMALTEDEFYELPPLSLLEHGTPARTRRVRQDIEEKTRVLEETLESFGVKGKVIDVRRGPMVTCFEFQPAPGVKVSRIVGLADDIALNLASRDVRIEAPIPGKRAVGIEVPNQEVATVALREVLEEPAVVASPSRLTVVLGKDITGRPITGDLDRLLHVLIAGATGSGKSVCINSIIASLLVRAKPSEVKLLLIDPKVVELSTYEGIPHLVAPVVTDPKKAAGCLRWAVKQMEERYELFAAAGVRDIARYNGLVARYREEGAAALEGASRPVGPAPLPYIVIVIDELADLMMVAPVDVEDAIWRLAQMARAAGIHLIVATQRPSVDVITGTIKANIPTRVAFAVSSQVDSRTIIDGPGAEKLLGHGDMLFMPVGTTKPVRVQGAYISDREIEALVEYVRTQGRPRFAPDILSVEESARDEETGSEDDLFEDAVRVVMETGQASISMLQRKLRVGYTRAGRLIDMMEEKGLVGPFEGSKAREILMTGDQYRRAKEAARRAVAEARSSEAAAGERRPPVTPGMPGGRGPVVTLPGGRRLSPPGRDDEAEDDDDYLS